MVIDSLTLALILPEEDALVFWSKSQKLKTTASGAIAPEAWDHCLREHPHGASTEDLPRIYQQWWMQQGRSVVCSHAVFVLDAGVWRLREPRDFRLGLEFLWLRVL